jgi:integrase
VEGRRLRIRRGGFRTRGEAKAALNRLRLPDRSGRRVATVGQWLTVWSETRLRLRHSTSRSYRSIIEHYLVPYLGKVPLAELDHKVVAATFRAIIKRGGVSGRPLTAATLHRIHSTFSAALNRARRKGLIAGNPARLVRLPRSRRPQAVMWLPDVVAAWEAFGIRPAVAVWTPTQLAQFLTRIRGHRLYAALHLTALRGLRRGEVAGLRWCDVDLDNAVIHIAWQLQQRDGDLVVGPPKTAAGQRWVALDSLTVEALRAHRRHQLAELREAGAVDTGYVFTNPAGLPMPPARLSNTFRRLIKVPGLPPVRLHDLRHGAASLELAVGADLKLVSDQRGHSSIVLTADTYVSILPHLVRDVVEDVAQLLLEQGLRVPGRQGPRRPFETCATVRMSASN